MKHQHNATMDVKLDVPTQDLEDLIDKVTESAIIVIGALTVSHILKTLIK